MKLYYFSEMPHHEFPDEEGDKYPSLRLEFPNRFFDREKAAANYQRYLTEYEFADQAGFDGLMINEHHSTPSCVNVGVNMTAAVLGRTTRRAKILLLGNILPIEDNPVRMAEQLAMADLISGGRVLSGFVRGVGVETWWSNTNPVHNRERFEECHDLILKCWTSPGPFRWEGRHYHFRHVNPWCLPLQRPHPPIWIPGTASPETAVWAGRRGYTYVPFLVPFEIARELFEYYRQGAAEVGRTVTPDNLGFLICAIAADTKAKAVDLDGAYILKTDRQDLTDAEIWRLYMLLTRVEAAFRAMKSPLMERPIFHHLEHRVQTHIFLCVLAYHLLAAIEKRCLDQGLHTSWATLREQLSTHQVVTVVLPATTGQVLKIRKASTPEPAHREIYRTLQIPHEVMKPVRTWSDPTT